MVLGSPSRSIVVGCLFLLFVTLLLTPPILQAYATEPMTLRAYLAKTIPEIDGKVSDGEWSDTSLFKESITRTSVAFKHDSENLYVLALFSDNAPSPKDYFGLEFDQNGDLSHMGSPENPDYSILVSPSYGNNQAKEFMLPGPAKPIPFEEKGLVSKVEGKMVNTQGGYVVELKRPFQRGDGFDGVSRFFVGQTIGIGFVTGELGKGTAHRATDMASYGLLIVSEPYKGGQVQEASFDVYGFASTYGQYIQFFAVVGVLLHLMRRRAWKDVERSVKVDVVRHVRAARVAHWVRVSSLAIFAASGWSIFTGQPIFGSATSFIHVAIGFVILFVELPLHIYAISKNGEFRYLVIPSGDDLKVTFMLFKNFFGLTPEYPHHAVYDPSNSEYYMGRKYCSLQKFLVLGYFPIIAGFGLTGFAMWYPQTLPWVFTILGGGVAVRGFHLLLFYLFTSIFFVHVYLSIIPANWDRLKAMVKGSCKIPIYETAELRGLQQTLKIS